VFAPSLEQLVGDAGPDAAEVARVALEVGKRAGATHIQLPFDVRALAAAIGSVDELVDVEPPELFAGGSLARVIETAGFVARLHPVVAQVPSPVLLVEQLGGDEADRDAYDAADDVCTIFARQLVEVGAVLLLVVARPDEEAEPLDAFGRLAEVYGAEFVMGGSAEVATLSLEDMLDPERAAQVAGTARVVVGAEPLPADADLAAISATARAVTEGALC
jgi:hypothetical protein